MRTLRLPCPFHVRRWVQPGGAALGVALMLATGAAEGERAAGSSAFTTASKEQPRMKMKIGNQAFAVTLEDNPAARAFVQLLPATFEMAELNGNEKHATLPRTLPTNAIRPGTIRAGDVMLYGDDTLVVFYKTFSSVYSYTRIGRAEESAGLAQALGAGTQRVAFSAP